MNTPRDCRNVPGEDAPTITPHHKSELTMTSRYAKRRLVWMHHPQSGEKCVAIITRPYKKKNSPAVVVHTPYDHARRMEFTDRQAKREVEPNIIHEEFPDWAIDLVIRSSDGEKDDEARSAGYENVWSYVAATIQGLASGEPIDSYTTRGGLI